MKNNKAFMIASLGKDDSLSLNGMIDEEIAQNVIECNGENNAKKLDKSLKGQWQYKYNSTGRNLVRMWWLTKFVTAMFENFQNNPGMTLVQTCHDAYSKGFADHHPWLVRKGAGLAMNFAGEKDALF